MTDMAEQTGTGEQSTTEQAKEKVQETAQQVQQKAHEVKGQASDRVRQELDNRSKQAGSQLQFTADAMRRTGEQLKGEGKEGPAKVTTVVADRAERLGNYMTDANADKILRDVEDFARRQPWLVAVGGVTLGFLASRFVKASSSRRYEEGRDLGNGQRYPYSDMMATGYPSAGQSGYASAELGAGLPLTSDEELAYSLDDPLTAGGLEATSTTPVAPTGTGKGGRPGTSGEPRGS